MEARRELAKSCDRGARFKASSLSPQAYASVNLSNNVMVMDPKPISSLRIKTSPQ
jgi:hypothetical protein